MKLLFIHGSGGSREAWVYQTEYFAGADAVALPGHPEGKPCQSIDEYVTWLRAYIRRQRYQDVVLVGHSLGGAIALLYGLEHGNGLKGLVLIGTGARLKVHPDTLASVEGMIGNQGAWRQYVADYYASDKPAVRAMLIEARIKVGPSVLLSDFLCCDKFDVMARVNEIKVPTLVLCGRADEMTPVKYSEFLAARITGARKVIIEGATHAVPREKPLAVNQAIEQFLATLD